MDGAVISDQNSQFVPLIADFCVDEVEKEIPARDPRSAESSRYLAIECLKDYTGTENLEHRLCKSNQEVVIHENRCIRSFLA